MLPKYFPKQSKYKSFRRQLQYYGFFTMGWNHFSHHMFVRKQEELLVHIRHKKAKKKSALQQGNQTRIPSMIPATASSMEKLAGAAASPQQHSVQEKALYPSLTIHQSNLEQQEPALRQRQQLSIVSEPGDTSKSSVTSCLPMSKARSLDVSRTPSPSTIAQDNEAAGRRLQPGLFAQLNLPLPEINGYAVSSAAELQTALLQREMLDRNIMNQALLMTARTDSDFIELARFQLGL